ncbi:hypothetical protein [Sulfurimonas sp.]
MKKLILFLLCVNTILMSSNSTIEQKIYAKTLHELFKDKQQIEVWCDDKEKIDMIAKIPHIKITDFIETANILIIFHSFNISQDKIIFVGTYNLLKHYKENAIGGFFWQKGRPNILFLKDNLKKYDLNVSQDLEQYVKQAL